MKKTNLGEMEKEIVDRNFLEENPDIPLEKKVVVAKEIPKMETIIFQNFRDGGTTLNFHYASATHPLKHYDLVHGQEYTLPVEVINHLEGNNKSDPYSCHKRMYARRMRPDGISETYANQYVAYFQCKSVRK